VIHFETLPNGLTLLAREMHAAPVVNLQIWVRVGSADERPGEEGLAHFHEHMLFKGTERRGVGEVAAAIEGAGGNINAYTSFDVTVYYATLPSDARAVALDVLSDAVRNSIFDPDEVARETEVVLEEIRRSEDSPYHVLGEAVYAEAYRSHAYGRPILGPPENVAGFQRESVRRFFERWYTPENMVVVAAGDFEARKFAAEVAEAFGDATAGSARRNRVAEPLQTALRPAVITRPFEGLRFDLSWIGAAAPDEDALHLDLLSFVLGECESSRLVQRVKDRNGSVDRIDSSSYSPLDPGLFSVTAETDAARGLQALGEIAEEVERLRCERISEEELERARLNFLTAEHFERESVSGCASKLGGFHVLAGDWQREGAYFDSVRKASADDLLRVARTYLSPERLTAGLMLPEQEAAASGISNEAVAEVIETAATRTRRRFEAPRRSQKRDEIHSYEFENGAELHVWPRRDVPVVAGRAAFLGGLLADQPEAAGLCRFSSALWMRGTQSRSASDYARAVENRATEIDSFAGRNSVGLVFETTADQLEPCLDLLAEAMLEPAFLPSEIERERRETLAAIQRREDQLAHQAFRLLALHHYETHPYRLPMLGDAESVAGFTREDVLRLHERLIAGQNLTIGVSGDVDPDALALALSTRLAPLPAGARLEEPAREDAPSAIRRVRLQKQRAQTHLVMGFRGLCVDDPDRDALEVIAQVLAGQGGRLFLELRDRQGLAYTVSASNLEGVAPGLFSIYIATAPEKTDAALAGILVELERFLTSPPSDAEMNRAKRYLAGSFAVEQQRNASRAAHLTLDGLYGLGADNQRGYQERVAAVSKEDVARVAARVLRLDAYTLALVGDLGDDASAG
jgi:zinc protease